jgi:hypothetical protein
LGISGGNVISNETPAFLRFEALPANWSDEGLLVVPRSFLDTMMLRSYDMLLGNLEEWRYDITLRTFWRLRPQPDPHDARDRFSTEPAPETL